VLVALGHFYEEERPDIVVSGINIGANLGQDRFYSGTIAAAREAAFRGLPAIAVSLVLHRPKDMMHFETAANYVAGLIKKGIAEFIPPLTLLNINVPNLPPEEIKGASLTTTGYQKYSEEIIKRTDGRGKSYFWVGGTYQGIRRYSGQ
jgi:5'-nucleotidase